MGEVTAEMIERGRGHDALALERRRRARSVREIRARFGSEAGESAFDDDLLRIYASSRLSSAVLALLIAMTVAFMATFWIAPLEACAWFGFVAIGLIIASFLAKRFLSAEQGKTE